MFIKMYKSGYKSNGEQYTSGLFLALLQPKNGKLTRYNMRAIVRRAALKQFGHWMMGTIRINNKSFTVSGSYGSDGLPMSVDSDIYNMGYPVPPELYDLWNSGGGWNGAGTESGAFREWALSNLDKLTPKK